MEVKEKLLIYINKNLDTLNNFKFRKARAMYEKTCIVERNVEEDLELSNASGFKEIGSSSNLDDYIESNKEDNMFQKLLFKYIDERNLKDSDVYNKVHIDRRLFSKIRSDSLYHPSKETIILLGFSLELREDEVDKLLKSAAYSLPKNNIYDLIIRFCFVEGIYNLVEVNELLDSYNCKLLAY